MRRLLAVCLAVSAVLALAGSASAKIRVLPRVEYPGIQHLHYRFGPIKITPGQNTINFRPNLLKPHVPGYITRFRPNLICAHKDGICSRAGEVPRVDVIHLHHGVWLMNGYPTFAAGEEKTILQMPKGYGYAYKPSDFWLMNYMIHNLTPTPTEVYVTYDIDLVPSTSPAAKTMTPVHPLWMDVAGIRAYPVFDVLKGSGHHGRYTFPDDARGAARARIGGAQTHTFNHPVTLIGTAGHLHPGGLHDDLKLTRAGRTTDLFRSVAHYFEPAGAVSWDVTMGATRGDWKPIVQPGDVLSVHSTYDSSRASWYESMGIMVVWYANGIRPGALDAFSPKLDHRWVYTHGHLAENRHHGGEDVGLPVATALRNGKSTLNVLINDFRYGQGDLNNVGPSGRPPVIRAGQSLTFKSLDSSKLIYHTITACKSPCNKATGIAYPLANGPVRFDSGQLAYFKTAQHPQYESPLATAASGRITWQTPKNLKPGTYNYFCRVHPFMRGAFRVVSYSK